LGCELTRARASKRTACDALFLFTFLTTSVPEITKSRLNRITECNKRKDNALQKRTSNNDLLVFGSSIVGKY